MSIICFYVIIRHIKTLNYANKQYTLVLKKLYTNVTIFKY